MKKLTEILKDKRLQIVERDFDGMRGYYIGKHTRGTVIASYGGGWEHVSIRPYKGKMPTWEDMCEMKDAFWNEDEVVIQFHPAKKDYVNIADNCLHLWRPVNETIPVPPKLFV